MSSLSAKQLENAHAFRTHINSLDWVALGELMAPDFRHQYFPSSIITSDGKEMRGKDEYINTLKYTFQTMFEKITVRFHTQSP
jgi:hypothetical protein